MYSYLLHYYALCSHEYGDMGSTHIFGYNQDQNTVWNKPQNSFYHNNQAGMLNIRKIQNLILTNESRCINKFNKVVRNV